MLEGGGTAKESLQILDLWVCNKQPRLERDLRGKLL